MAELLVIPKTFYNTLLMFHISIKIILLLFFFGCAADHSSGWKDFEIPEADSVVAGSKIFTEEFSIADIGVCHDSGLIIIVRDVEPLFTVYDKNYKKQGSFGLRGRGPGEFTIVPFIQEMKGSACLLTYFDSITRQLIELDVIASLEYGETVKQAVLQQTSSLAGSWNAYKLENEFYFGMYDDKLHQQFDGKRGVYVLRNNSDVSTIETEPLYNLEFRGIDTELANPISAVNINARSWEFVRGKNTAISAMVYAPVIEIVEVSSAGEIEITKARYNELPASFTYTDYETERLVQYATALDAGLNHILLLLEGESIQTFVLLDFNLSVIKTMHTDNNYALSRIRYDSHSESVYALSYEDDAIYKFSLY